jgi:hypothetical protein
MAASMKMTVFWDDAMIALMMEAASTSETSVKFYRTTGVTTQKTAIFTLSFVCRKYIF